MDACIDTSVLIAAMIGDEGHHASCRALIVGGGLGLYSHGITETFSTLTGGRKAFRLSATVADSLLEDHFLPKVQIITLTPAEMLRALRETESRGVRGGAVFDYLHLVAARKAKAAKLYTLNASNFRSFHRAGDPEIVHP